MTQPMERHCERSTPMFAGDLDFCSNFDATPFWHPGLGAMVRSGEHAFNALKTEQYDERLHVLGAPTPAEAKRRGRRVTLVTDWDTGARVIAMRSVIEAKFAPSDPATPIELSQRLLATGELLLVETNHWHDQFWGSCTCERHHTIHGTNMLGELLMARRSELRR